MRRSNPNGGTDRSGEKGQGLVEFALVLPMLMVLFMSLLEIMLALNASLAVSRASQHGAHIAASAGNTLGADCLILRTIEEDLGSPNDSSNVESVLIQLTAPIGDGPLATQDWKRLGQTKCNLPDGTEITVPYSLHSSQYPASERCVVLKGCPTYTPARLTVDNVAVTVKYTHQWVTPLNGTLDLLVSGGGGSLGSSGSGWSFEQRNIFRMEPSL